MPDTSSASLDQLFQDLDGKKKLGGNLTDPLFEALDSERSAKTAAGARWAQQYDPETYAKAAKLAPDVPVEVAARQIKTVEERARLDQMMAVLDKSPPLKNYFAGNPKNLAFANPDELDGLSGINWAIRAFPAAVSAGYDQTQLGFLRYAQVAGESTPEMDKLAEQYSAQPSRTFGDHGGWFSGGLVGLAQSLPAMGYVLAGGAEGGLKGSIVGGATGATVGALVGGAGALPGGAAGMAMGGSAGAAYGSTMQNIKIQTGLAYNEFLQLRDEEGQPLDPLLAKWASLLAGVGGGALEQLGLSKTIGQIPGVDRLLGAMSKDGMKKVLLDKGMRGALLTFAKGLGTAVTVETLTEIGQEGMVILAQELAKQASGQDFETMSPGEVTERLAEAGVQALQVMTLLGPVTSGTRFASDLATMRKSKQANDRLREVGAQLEENGLLERAPQIAKDLIDAQAPEQKVYIPAKELRELYQSQNLDVYGPELPNWRQRFDDALAVEGDVELSLGEFYAHLAKSPKDDPIYDLARTDPRDYLPKEMVEYNSAMDQLLQTEIARADTLASADLDTKVKDLVAEQIKALGFTPEASGHLATVFNAYNAVKARQLGLEPMAMAEQIMPEFVRSMETNRGLVENGNEASGSLPDELYQTQEEGTELSWQELPETAVEGPAIAASVEQVLAEQAGVTELSQENRGSISFRQDGPPLIKAFEQADMSTLLHEAGHWFLQTTRDLAEKSPEIAADWAVIKRHLKIGDDNLITRDQHEQFARMAEAYFMEGKAPTPQLRKAFQAFRQWLKAIYKSITKLGGKVHPEIASVFDNMLRLDQALEGTAKDSPYAQVFKTAEEMGVSLEDFAAYQQLVEDLKDAAQASTIGRIVGQQQRLQTGWRKEIFNQLKKDAEAKLAKLPPYQHMNAFIEGGFRIKREGFEAKYGEASVKKFPRKAFAKDGLEPDVAAELLGYPTADEMVYDFVQALPIKEAAKQEAEAEMARRYGTDVSRQELLDLAVKRAMAEEGRLVVLGKEFKALQQKAGRTVSENGPRQMAQEIARRTIYGRKFKDVREAVTHAALRRNAAQADAAIAKGDWATAAEYKRKQLLAQALDNETQRVNRVVEKIRNKAARYTKTASKSVDPSTMEQIRALVVQYEFAKVSLKQLGKRESLREYLDKATAAGVVINVPDELLRRTERINYKELSVEELLGFGDVLDNLEHVGRLKQKLRTAKGLREWNEVKKEVMDSLAKLPTKQRKMDTYSNPKTSYFDGLMSFHATLLKPEQIIEWLDAGDIGGPLMEYVFQPIADAQTAQNELNLEYNTKLIEVFSSMPASYLGEKVQIASLGTTMSREEVFVTALNMGNDSNRRKLMEGHKWNAQVIEEITSHMSQQDWATAQKVWDLLDTLWPKVSALEKKLTGVAPPRIEGREFTNQYGTFRGGYYPVVYDFDSPLGMNLTEDTRPQDARGSVEDILFPNKFIRPGTNHVHTYKRQKVSKPIRLNLNVLPAHIHQVVHDLTYREAVRSAYKILWDPEIKRAIVGAESQDVYEQLTFWLTKVASEYAVEADPGERLANRLRTGATIYGMGYRVSTAISQPLGFFTALPRVGVQNMAGAIYQMARHPKQTRDMVLALSGELRHRFNNQERDIRDTVRSLSRSPTPLDKFRALAFWHIGVMDQWTSTTIWLAAYGKQLEKNPKDSAKAVAVGDRTVRLTQGTGNVKDMAKIVNSGPWQKLFTLFYSFFSAQYNMQVDLTRKTKRDIREGNITALFTERLADWTYIVVLPAIFGALVTGQGPEEDENKAAWALRKTLLYPLAAVPYVRDALGIFEGFRYRFTPAAKAFEEATRGLGKLASGDPVGAIDPAVVALSTWLKLPLGQARTTLSALWEGLDNDDLEATDLVYGRRDK